MSDDQHTVHESRRDQFLISTDPSRLDLDFIHDFLARQSYWAKDIPREVVERSIRHSLCFGLYENTRQIGFARVITDRATYAYLCDVLVDERYRGQGLGVWLIECIIANPELQGLRRFTLATVDAHALNRKFGFSETKHPERLMEIHHPNAYAKAAQGGEIATKVECS